MNWIDLPEFSGIDLQDSWVLSWVYAADRLAFQVEASIWPSSRYYESPKSHEYTCYKLANLSFENCRAINGIIEMSDARSIIGPNGEIDYGSIDNLEVGKDGYRIDGEFGNVVVVGGVMRFDVET